MDGLVRLGTLTPSTRRAIGQASYQSPGDRSDEDLLRVGVGNKKTRPLSK